MTQVGNTFTQVALPILADIGLGAGALQLGILIALQRIPFPALGLFVGVWADRFQKRSIMILCNVGRMVTLASIPVTFHLGVLSLNQLYLVGLVNGIFQVFFDISYQAYLPTLIEKQDLVEGNSKLQLSASGSQLAGPSLAGFATQIIGAAYAIGVDAIGYLTSVIALLNIRKREAKLENKGTPNFFREMREGIDVVIHNRILTHIMGATATTNLGGSILASPYIVFVLNNLHFSKFAYGALGSFGALGFLMGVVLTPAITKKLGLGLTLAVGIASSFLSVLNPLAQYGYSFMILAAVSLAIGLFIPAYNINQVSLRQAIVDVKLQGRMNATVRTVVWGTLPLGSFMGGILANTIGVINTLYLGGFVGGVAFLWIITGPVFKMKEHPKPEDTSIG
ncbi:MAG: MFS transporter [Nitrososphaerota archaeon]|nr:MFS transporter [Nitrososphaerota archaeon]